MSFLSGIWWLSWALAGTSILMMIVLIFIRVWKDNRKQAAKIRREQLEALVINALDDPERLRGLSFAEEDMEAVGEIVRKFLNIIRGRTRADLIDILEELGAARFYLERLEKGGEEERMRALGNLSIFENEAIRDRLWDALVDPSPTIRMAAAMALANSTYEFPIADFIARLQVGTVVKTRNLRTLFKVLAKKNRQAMAAILTKDDNDLTKILVIHALGRAGAYEVLETILPMAKHASIDVRAETYRTLAQLQHPGSIPAILKGLDDPAWEVRSQAAIAAGRVGFPEAVPVLETMLDDPQWWVRYRAAGSLLNLAEPGLSALRRHAGKNNLAGKVASLMLAESGAA